MNGWFDRLMLHSGIQTPPAVWLMLCLLVGVTHWRDHLRFLREPAGDRRWILYRHGRTNCRRHGAANPTANSRSWSRCRAWPNLLLVPHVPDETSSHSFRAVAADTPAPLGDLLRLVVRRTEMGMDLGNAVRDLTERTGVTTLTLFGSAVGVHQDTGGDLIQVLERLATAVRDRLHFVNRMRAATVASRLGAIIDAGRSASWSFCFLR